MAVELPEILMPEGLRFTQAHEIDPISAYGVVAFQRGHSRTRRKHREPPRIVAVELDLTTDETAQFVAWYEDVLLAGEREFSTELANQGPGLLWWPVRWLGEIEYVPSQVLDWTVRGKLWARGEGSLSSPTSLTMELAVEVRLTAVGALNVGSPLGLEIHAEMSAPVRGVGAAAGTSSASAPGYGARLGQGIAAGTATVTGEGLGPRTVTAHGVATVLGYSAAPGLGLAAGTSTAFAISQGLSAGAAAGAATVTAAGRSLRAGAGAAAGVATASAASI